MRVKNYGSTREKRAKVGFHTTGEPKNTDAEDVGAGNCGLLRCLREAGKAEFNAVSIRDNDREESKKRVEVLITKFALPKQNSKLELDYHPKNSNPVPGLLHLSCKQMVPAEFSAGFSTAVFFQKAATRIRKLQFKFSESGLIGKTENEGLLRPSF